MAYSLIQDFSESRLFPTKTTLGKFKPKQIAELLLLYLCAMRIMFCEPETHDFAQGYARQTVLWNGFDQWRGNENDLYFLLHALRPQTHEQGASWYPLNHKVVLHWLKDNTYGHPDNNLMRRLFVRLDSDLRITDIRMRSIRRQVMEWPDLTSDEQQDILHRMFDLIRRYAPKSEILKAIRSLSRRQGISIREDEIDDTDIVENASSGATGSANVATVTGGLGAGFDPNGDYGIYSKPKKAKKPMLLRR